MNLLVRHRTLAACAVLAALVASRAGQVGAPVSIVIAAPAQQEGHGAAVMERRIAPLKVAGINTESEKELLQALQHEQISVRIAAVYLLKTRKVTSAVPAITAMMNGASATPFLRLEACDALADLAGKATSWKPACADLTAPGNDMMIRVRAAGVLARTGDARGWPLVKESLASSLPSDVEEAVMAAPLFNGLVDPAARDKATIVVPLVAVQAFAGANQASQGLLVGLLGRTARPADAPAVSALLDSAKSPSIRNSLNAVLAKLGRP